MTVLWMDGFDHYDDDDHFKGANGVTTANSPVLFFSGRFGYGQCLRYSGSADNGCIRLLPVGATEPADFTFGLALRSVSSIDTDDVLFAVGGSINSDGGVYLSEGFYIRGGGADGYGFVMGDGTSETTPYEAPQQNVWYYLEIVQDSVAGTLSLYVNGQLHDSFSYDAPVVPRFLGPVYSGSGLGSWGERYLDDAYLIDSTARLGDVRVETHMPTDEGFYDDWTSSTSSVNSAVDVSSIGSDWFTDFISSATAADKSTYTSSATLVGTPVAIHAVCVMGVVSQDNSGSREWRLLARDNGVDDASSTSAGFSPYSGHRHIMETRPFDASAWDKASVEALEFGVEVVS